MAMLKQWATGTNSMTYLLPNSAPTDAATTPYAKWIADGGNYSTTAKHLGTTATRITGTYELGKMWKYRKILKRVGKFNHTNMSA